MSVDYVIDRVPFSSRQPFKNAGLYKILSEGYNISVGCCI